MGLYLQSIINIVSLSVVFFRYSSVVGIMIYVSGHIFPYTAFAVIFCARCMFFFKNFHDEALKQIVWYFKLTRDRVLILIPNRGLFKINSYPYAYFSGIYVHENPTDPACVKSLAGCVITFLDCPVLCQSKIHTETALSTMGAYIFALSQDCR